MFLPSHEFAKGYAFTKILFTKEHSILVKWDIYVCDHSVRNMRVTK